MTAILQFGGSQGKNEVTLFDRQTGAMKADAFVAVVKSIKKIE